MKNITDMLAQNTGWLSQCFDVSASKIKMPAFIRVSPKTENPNPIFLSTATVQHCADKFVCACFSLRRNTEIWLHFPVI